MRNLIVSYKKLPSSIQRALESMYPEGYEDDTFEFEIPGKKNDLHGYPGHTRGSQLPH
jgi:hypothetical protein